MNKFYLNMFVSPEEFPDFIGEFLRDSFFDQSKGKGCYETFDLKEDVENLPDESIDTSDWDSNWIDNNIEYVYRCAKKVIDDKVVIMKYYWDGDGVLEFHFEDGSILENNDCKCSYDWEYIEKEN
jgi:hypothetical protein